MKPLCYLSLLLAVSFLSGCGGGASMATTSSDGGSFASSPHVANDLIRVGDKITVRLSGVPDGGYAVEVQVPEAGNITLPLLTNSFNAAGKTTGSLSEEIVESYKSNKIYTNPHIAVELGERYINVSGDVRSPQRVLYTADSTLLSTIISCGGFDEYAKRNAVQITRGKQIIIVDCAAAARTPGGDPPVYPGDLIFVPRTMF